MKFTFRVRVDDAPEDKLVLAKAPSEVEWHLALKLLGRILWFEDRPTIEKGVDWHYKPDLVAKDAEGRVTLWIDCGNIALRKIDRVATKIGDERFVILRRTVRDARRLADGVRDKVKRKERVQLVAFDDGFVDALATAFDATNELACRRSPDELSVVLANRRGRLERTSRIHRLHEEDPS